MKTIVKGKIQEIKYRFEDYRKYHLSPFDYYVFRIFNNQDHLNIALDRKHRIEDYSEDTYIIKENPITIDYETFYTSDKLEYTLNVGDLIFIKDYSYKIEKVEGLDDNSIIYYVDNVLNTEEDFISLTSAQDAFKDYKENELKTVNEEIKSLQQLIENEKKELEIQETEKRDIKIKKKWYHFGK